MNWALGFIHATRVFMARVQRSCEKGYSVQTLSLQAEPHQIESAWVLSVQSHNPPPSSIGPDVSTELRLVTDIGPVQHIIA